METTFRMSTDFGKRRGWEIQRLRVNGRAYYRITLRHSCHPASPEAVALWRFAGLPFGLDDAREVIVRPSK